MRHVGGYCYKRALGVTESESSHREGGRCVYEDVDEEMLMTEITSSSHRRSS